MDTVKDSACQCLVALARMQQVAADYQQLRHQFGKSDTPFDDTDPLRASKPLGFKARVVGDHTQPDTRNLSSLTLWAIGKARDGSYFIPAKLKPANDSELEGQGLQALIIHADQQTLQ